MAAYLILSGRGSAQPRNRIGALLWSETDDGRSAANMRQALARIRHLQDEHGLRFIEANFSTVHLAPNHDVNCDLIAFGEYLAGTRPLTPVQLCSLYGGELLGGLDVGGEGFEEWLAMKRDQLLAEAIDGISAGISPQAGLALADRAACARRLLEIDPYHEEALRVLMHEAAERHQVLRLTHLYESMRTVLADDLGIQPSPETQALYVRLIQAINTA